MSTPSRQPAGVPTGGQFAAGTKARADVTLDGAPSASAVPTQTAEQILDRPDLVDVGRAFGSDEREAILAALIARPRREIILARNAAHEALRDDDHARERGWRGPYTDDRDDENSEQTRLLIARHDLLSYANNVQNNRLAAETAANNQQVAVTHTGPDGAIFEFQGVVHDGVQRQAELAAQGIDSQMTAASGGEVLDADHRLMSLPRYAHQYTPAQRSAVVGFLAELPLQELHSRQEITRAQTRTAYEMATSTHPPIWASDALEDLQNRDEMLTEAVMLREFGDPPLEYL